MFVDEQPQKSFAMSLGKIPAMDRAFHLGEAMRAMCAGRDSARAEEAIH
jgi:hypothetical protein